MASGATQIALTPDDYFDLCQDFAKLQSHGISLGDPLKEYHGQWPSELIASINAEFRVSSDRPASDLILHLSKLIRAVVTEVGIEDSQEVVEYLNSVDRAIRKGGAA